MARAGKWVTADDLNPGPWQNLEMQNGWAWRNLSGDNYYVPGCRGTKYGVQIVGSAYKVGGGTSGQAVARFPPEFRPASDWFSALATNGTSPIILLVSTLGYLIAIGTVPTTLHFSGFVPLSR